MIEVCFYFDNCTVNLERGSIIYYDKTCICIDVRWDSNGSKEVMFFFLFEWKMCCLNCSLHSSLWVRYEKLLSTRTNSEVEKNKTCCTCTKLVKTLVSLFYLQYQVLILDFKLVKNERAEIWSYYWIVSHKRFDTEWYIDVVF